MTVTETLVKELNELRGLKYPDVGYTMWADIRGTGMSVRQLYVIISPGGGVTRSELRRPTHREECNAIRAAIAAEKAKAK